jgi:uncharacterized membrane protein YvbJ
MDFAPLFGLIICITVLFFLCVVTFAAYVFVRVFKAQKTMHKKFDTFRKL